MTLSVGLVGAGRMGRLHLGKIGDLEGVKVVGICDTEESRARALTRLFRGRAYANLTEMLQNENLDVLYVCNPVQSHGDAARLAASEGIHLFLEKPLTLDLREGRELVEAVEKAGIICAVGYQYRYQGVLEKIHEAIGTDPISLAHGYWYWTVPPVAATRSKEVSGGPIVDQLTHLIDLGRLFAGEVERVSAEYTLNTRWDEDFDNWDGSSVILRFESGAIGSFSSTLSLYPSLIEKPNMSYMGLELFARNKMARFRPDNATIFRSDHITEWSNLGGDIDHEFIRACRLRDPTLVRSPIREAYKSLAVSLACNEAALRGESVKVREFIREMDGLL